MSNAPVLIGALGAAALVSAGAALWVRRQELSLGRVIAPDPTRVASARGVLGRVLLHAPGELIGRVLGSTIGIAAVLLPFLLWLTHNAVATVLASILMAVGFTTLRERQRRRAYRERMLAQLGVMVMRIEQLLSAKSLVQSLTSLDDLPEPLATVMNPILAEISETSRVGRPMRKLAEAFPTPETTMLATVFEIAEESGSQVRQNLNRIAGTIRRRLEMAQEVRAQTAEARNELRMVLGMFAALLVGGRIFMTQEILRAMSSTAGAVFALCTPFVVLLLVESILSMGQD